MIFGAQSNTSRVKVLVNYWPSDPAVTVTLRSVDGSAVALSTVISPVDVLMVTPEHVVKEYAVIAQSDSSDDVAAPVRLVGAGSPNYKV